MMKKLFFPSVLLVLTSVFFACTGQELTPVKKKGDGGKGREVKKSFEPADYGKHPIVEFQTTKGNIEVVFNGEKAPRTVETILTYCLNGFYVDTIFHRIMAGFVAQGGGWIPEAGGEYTKRTPSLPGIPEECNNGLKHMRGALSMAKARGQLAKSQFFILLKQRPDLDGKYAVFGKVIKGMDVVDSWVALPKGKYKHMALGDCPADPPKVIKVIVKKGE